MATTVRLPPGGKERRIPGVNKKNKRAEKINIIKFILLNYIIVKYNYIFYEFINKKTQLIN